MTKALEEVFKEASLLGDREQDALAAAILEELRAETMWEATLANTRAALERLADEALAEHRSGRSEPLDPRRL